MGKDKRKKKTGGKAVAKSCQNNGDCSYCRSNRTINNQKREQSSIEQMKDVLNK